MPSSENTGYLVQLKSPEGENVYPIISAEMIKDKNGETYDLPGLFQSVSEGKSAIAAAVTDKGVETAADASFEQIAANISSISTLGGPGSNEITVLDSEVPVGSFAGLTSGTASGFTNVTRPPSNQRYQSLRQVISPSAQYRTTFRVGGSTNKTLDILRQSMKVNTDFLDYTAENSTVYSGSVSSGESAFKGIVYCSGIGNFVESTSKSGSSDVSDRLVCYKVNDDGTVSKNFILSWPTSYPSQWGYSCIPISDTEFVTFGSENGGPLGLVTCTHDGTNVTGRSFRSLDINTDRRDDWGWNYIFSVCDGRGLVSGNLKSYISNYKSGSAINVEMDSMIGTVGQTPFDIIEDETGVTRLRYRGTGGEYGTIKDVVCTPSGDGISVSVETVKNLEYYNATWGRMKDYYVSYYNGDDGDFRLYDLEFNMIYHVTGVTPDLYTSNNTVFYPGPGNVFVFDYRNGNSSINIKSIQAHAQNGKIYFGSGVLPVEISEGDNLNNFENSIGIISGENTCVVP